MNIFRVALWSVDFSFPVSSMDEWIGLVALKAAEAKVSGARVLVLPEWVGVHWYHFAPALSPGEGLAWMAARVPEVVDRLRKVARDTGIAVVAGTHPVPAPMPYPAPLYPQTNDVRANTALVRYFNRAFVIGANGEMLREQDKMVLTPWEMDEQGDNMQGGQSLACFELDGVKTGLLVCLDVQQSVLARALYKQGVELLLVPSMTLHPSGHNRVFLNARARAVEGLMGVAVVGGVGVPPFLEGRETNFSGAGIYGPCEMDMAPDGVIAQTQGSYGMSRTSAGELLVGDVPIAKIREKRTKGAEAWPGVIG